MNFISQTPSDTDEEKVQTVCLDQFCSHHSINKIDLLKIDIQGHEYAALQGAEQLIRTGRIETIFMELNWDQRLAGFLSCHAVGAVLAEVRLSIFEARKASQLATSRRLVAGAERRCRDDQPRPRNRSVTTSYLILVCLGGLLCLLWLLRRDRVSLGLPIAYLYSLLLIHLPGALAHVLGRDFLLHSDLVDVAMRYTAVGVICFVLGCWWARSSAIHTVPIRTDVDRPRFWWFCFIGGLVLSFGLSPLYDIPSFNALGDKGQRDLDARGAPGFAECLSARRP